MKALITIIVVTLLGSAVTTASMQSRFHWSTRSCNHGCKHQSRALAPLFGGLNPWEFHQVSGVSLKHALALIDHANEQDTSMTEDNNSKVPKELLYSQRLYQQVLKLNSDASETLQLAARGQHIQRWMIPRDTYPMTKAGYLEWRAQLKIFHANSLGRILKEVGYTSDTIEGVKALVLKKTPKDPDAQTLEDALCLVFLQWQLDDFIEKYGDAKTINALRKSWGKMSEVGRAEALKLALSERASELVGKALST